MPTRLVPGLGVEGMTFTTKELEQLFGRNTKKKAQRKLRGDKLKRKPHNQKEYKYETD